MTANSLCGCGKPWPAAAIKYGAQCIGCGQNSPPPLAKPQPTCPDCGTDLTRLPNRRGGHYQWCWKCERVLRPGEARKAEEDRDDC